MALLIPPPVMGTLPMFDFVRTKLALAGAPAAADPSARRSEPSWLAGPSKIAFVRMAVSSV